MTDVKTELARRFPEIGIQNPYHVFSSNTPLLELTYADDIILFSKSTVVLQEVFTTLQQHADKYCMQLNLDKTCIMHMNTPVPHPIYYFTPLHPYSKAVKVAYATKYLGVSVNEQGTLKSHIGPKLVTARQSFNKLQRLWSHNDIETKFKLKIYKGIFPHIILYAMHHDWHTTTTLNKMDAWHCKQLRRTMKVKTTYFDRTKTNAWVYQHAGAEKLSDTIGRRQIKYFAHVARHPDDIIYHVCFGPQHTARTFNTTRRRGRPRQHWTPNTEQSTSHACDVAGRPAANRQQLFKVCQDRKFLMNLTERTGRPIGAQHAGRQPDRLPIASG